MRALRQLLAGVRALWSRDAVDADLDRELQAFAAASIDAKVAAGMSRDAAERAARLEVGSAAAVKDWTRDAGWESRVESLGYDLRQAVRLLARSKAFSAVTVVVLALGTGVNAAMFQLLNAVRFQPLPVEAPGELVSIGIDMHGKGRVGMGYRGGVYTEPLWQALQAEQQAFSSVFAWGNDRWDLSTSGEAQPAQGLYVSGSLFGGLGVRPHLGRLLDERDDRPGCGSPPAVLSHAFWTSRYGADPGVVGSTITLSGRPAEIVGIAPAGFFGLEVGRSFDVAIPLCAEAGLRGRGRTNPAVWWLAVMGRLKPEWSLPRAQAHLATISAAIFEATVPATFAPEWAATYRAYTLTAEGAANGVSPLRTDYSRHLWLLFGATGLILLITCANLTSLTVARATARGREIAIRLAIGAPRSRVVRHMVLESLLLASLAAAAGLLIARWLSGTIVALLSTESTPIALDLGPDWRAFAYMSGVVLFVSLLLGVLPALRATRRHPGAALQGGRSTTAARETLGLRRALVVAQVALSVVLLVWALLFIRTLQNLGSVALGFHPDTLAVYVNLTRTGVEPAGRRAVVDSLLEAVRAVPGVRHVSEVFIVPLSGPEWNGRIAVDGVRQDGTAYFNAVGRDYFTALGIPVAAGRAFDERDVPGAPRTAVVSEAFARRYFPGGNPIGRRFQMEVPPGAPQPSFEIVGVAGDTKYDSVREGVLPVAYFAMAQEPSVPAVVPMVVETDLPAAAATRALTRTIADRVPGVSVGFDPLSQYVENMLRSDRLMAMLAAILGGLALAIALVGLYGIVAYTVTRRTVEIGIRLALGARPGGIVRMILAETGLLVLSGIAAGTVLAVAAAQSATQLLFGVAPLDPVSFGLATGTLAAAGLLAAWSPARRGSSVPPTVALRQEV